MSAEQPPPPVVDGSVQTPVNEEKGGETPLAVDDPAPRGAAAVKSDGEPAKEVVTHNPATPNLSEQSGKDSPREKESHGLATLDEARPSDTAPPAKAPEDSEPQPRGSDGDQATSNDEAKIPRTNRKRPHPDSEQPHQETPAGAHASDTNGDDKTAREGDGASGPVPETREVKRRTKAPSTAVASLIANPSPNAMPKEGEDGVKYSSRGRRVGKAAVRLVEEEGVDWEGIREVQMHQKLRDFLQTRDRWPLLEARGVTHVELVEFLKTLHGRGASFLQEYRKILLDQELTMADLESENRQVLEVLMLLFIDQLQPDVLWKVNKAQLLKLIQRSSTWKTVKGEGGKNGSVETKAAEPEDKAKAAVAKRTHRSVSQNGVCREGAEGTGKTGGASMEGVKKHPAAGLAKGPPAAGPKVGPTGPGPRSTLGTAAGSPAAPGFRSPATNNVGLKPAGRQGPGPTSGYKSLKIEAGSGNGAGVQGSAAAKRGPAVVDPKIKEQLWKFVAEPELWAHLKWRSPTHNAYKEALREMREAEPAAMQDLRKVLEALYGVTMATLKAQTVQVLQVLAYVVSGRAGITHLSREQLIDLLASEGPWLQPEPNQKLRSINSPIEVRQALVASRSSGRIKQRKSMEQAVAAEEEEKRGEEDEEEALGEKGAEVKTKKGGVSGAAETIAGPGSVVKQMPKGTAGMGRKVGSGVRQEQVASVGVIKSFLGDVKQWPELVRGGETYAQIVTALRELREIDPEAVEDLKKILVANPDVTADQIRETKNPALRVLAYVLSEETRIERADRGKLLQVCLRDGPWGEPGPPSPSISQARDEVSHKGGGNVRKNQEAERRKGVGERPIAATGRRGQEARGAAKEKGLGSGDMAAGDVDAKARKRQRIEGGRAGVVRGKNDQGGEDLAEEREEPGNGGVRICPLGSNRGAENDEQYAQDSGMTEGEEEEEEEEEEHGSGVAEQNGGVLNEREGGRDDAGEVSGKDGLESGRQQEGKIDEPVRGNEVVNGHRGSGGGEDGDDDDDDWDVDEEDGKEDAEHEGAQQTATNSSHKKKSGADEMEGRPGHGKEQMNGEEATARKEIQSLGQAAVAKVEESLASSYWQDGKTEVEAREELRKAEAEVAELEEQEAALKQRLKLAHDKIAKASAEVESRTKAQKVVDERVSRAKAAIRVKVRECEGALQRHLGIIRELQGMPIAVAGELFTEREEALGAVWESLQHYKRLRGELEALGEKLATEETT